MLKKLIIIYTSLILLLAVLPINGTDSILNNQYILSIRLDYLVHFAIFVPWMMLIWLFKGLRFNRTPIRIFGWILAGIALGMATEFIQYFLPYRAFNINDLLANVMGVILGGVFFFFKRPGIWNPLNS
jgi:glycopeptide antibiotics resistance protein